MLKKNISKVIISSALLLCFNTTTFGGIIIESKSDLDNKNNAIGYTFNSTRTSTNYKPNTTNNTIEINNSKDTSNSTISTSKKYYDITINSKTNTIIISRNGNTSNSYSIPVSNPTSSNSSTTTPNTIEKDTSIPNGSISTGEKQLANLINKERIKNGLKPLKINLKLSNIAEKKSRDMYENSYFSHISPTFGKTFNLLKTSGLKYTYAAENIARTQSVSRAHSGFMKSAGHKANILNPKFTEIGIGIVGDKYTELFIAN